MIVVVESVGWGLGAVLVVFCVLKLCKDFGHNIHENLQSLESVFWSYCAQKRCKMELGVKNVPKTVAMC